MPTIGERIQKAWNAFRNRDPTPKQQQYLFSYGSAGSLRPDRRPPSPGSERSIITPLLNRIAVDAAAVDIRHVRLDDQNRYKEDINDELNQLLTVEANLDQTARAFKQDVYFSLLDEGYIAICPIDADVNYQTMRINQFKVASARVGRILAWYPKHIDVEVYNEEHGKRETIKMPKSLCVILQNPFYEIMNALSNIQRIKYLCSCSYYLKDNSNRTLLSVISCNSERNSLSVLCSSEDNELSRFSLAGHQRSFNLHESNCRIQRFFSYNLVHPFLLL